MDYDNDGVLDMISGSYDPGDVYLFRGLGKGKYAERESIVDENDVPLVHHPVEMAKYQEFEPDDYSDKATEYRVASFGSWVASVDWDGDKDLDMLIGSFSGGLFLRENIGSRDKPKYSGESVAIEADGKPLKENCHAAPVVSDWDGDGIFDLVIGSGDGSVGWYKNIGTADKPKFGARNLLVSPAYVRSSIKQSADEHEHGGKFLTQQLSVGDKPIPGARAQICVCDYNKDGKLDLIVGDYSDIEVARELSDQEQSELEKLKTKLELIGKRLKPLQLKLYGEAAKELDEKEKEKLEEEYHAIIEELMELDEKRKTYFAESRSASFVWLYLRKTKDDEMTLVNSTNKSDSYIGEAFDDPDSGVNAGVNENAPVSFDAKLNKDGDKHRITVEFSIKNKWHLYADAGSSGSREVELKLDLPDGVAVKGDWDTPKPRMNLKSTGQKLYKGSGRFARELKIPPGTTGEIKINVSYQVCNERMCMPPTTKALSVSID